LLNCFMVMCISLCG